MTSRRDSARGHVTNELDGMIRLALHERVASAVPSPEAWGRIRERVERLDGLRRAWIRRAPDLALQAVIAVLARVDVLLPAFEISTSPPDDCIARGYDLAWMPILDEHRMVMRLVC